MIRRRFSENAFELGLFCQNAQNGMAQITETLWDASWDANLALSRAAEECGLEFLLPLARWRSQRTGAPEPAYDGGAFECLAWAGGVLAATSRIAVFGTLHVAYINPVFAAKQITTLHHIGHGRFGLNIVSGTTPRDFAMFGLVPNEHDRQYDYTEEWLTIAKRLWTETEPFDFDGQFFRLRDVVSKPKPYNGAMPTIISAGHSAKGRAFALRNAHALFTSLSELETAPDEIRMARASVADGESVPIYGSSHLVARATRKEADDFYHYVVYELGDWTGVKEGLEARGARRTMPYASMERLAERVVSGFGTFLFKGSYDDVAATFKALYDAGLNGMAVAMIDYADQFVSFRDEILPRLERLGLRAPVRGAVAP